MSLSYANSQWLKTCLFKGMLMEGALVNTVLNRASQYSLSISLRIVRLMLSVLLITAVSTELTLSDFWHVALSILAIYTFVTGLFGRDPLLALLRRTNRRIPDHALDLVAQLECLFIGLICIVAGIIHHHVNSCRL